MLTSSSLKTLPTAPLAFPHHSFKLLYLGLDSWDSLRGSNLATSDFGSSRRINVSSRGEVPLLVVPLSPSLLLSPPLQPSPPLLIKSLSLEELALRRERDLFFNCDEKFHRGHRCASKVLFVEAKLPSLFWWCQRVIQSRIKIQVKIQEKTQDIQEPQEKHQDKYKKIFFKEKIE